MRTFTPILLLMVAALAGGLVWLGAIRPEAPAAVIASDPGRAPGVAPPPAAVLDVAPPLAEAPPVTRADARVPLAPVLAAGGPGSLLGRVVAAPTGEPLGAARILVRNPGGATIGDLASGADGRFELALDAVPADGVWLLTIPPRGWELAEPHSRVEAQTLLAREEVAILCDEARLAPVRGRVVETTLGTPLAGVRIKLQSRHVVEEVRTDGAGRFETRAGFPGRSLALAMEAPDGGTLEVAPRRLVHDVDRPQVHELRARLGPRLRLHVIGPADASAYEWKVRLVEREGLDGEVVRTWPYATVRRGDVQQVARWRRYWTAPDPALSATLEIEDAGGLWSGSTLLAGRIDEVHDVTVTVAALASVSGVVVDGEGLGFGDVTVGIARGRDAVAPRDPELWKTETTDPQGHFTIAGLEPGPYHLRWQPPYGPPTTTALELAPGARDLGRLVAPQGRVVGSVAGRIVSRAGKPVTNVVLVLESIEPAGVRRTLWTNSPRGALARVPLIGRRTGGAGIARFDFAEVPRGRYRVTPLSLDGYELHPLRVEVGAPTTELEFHLEDAVDTLELAVRAFDARSGAALETFRTAFSGPGWRFPGSRPARFDEGVGRVPREARLSWTVAAQGYRPAYGELASAVPRNGGLVIEARLEPGWGGELSVLDGSEPARTSDGSPDVLLEASSEIIDYPRPRPGARPLSGPRPLQGARVFADGELAGTSDARGRVRLELDAKPGRLEVVRDGWRLAPGSKLDAAELTDEAPHAIVWMVPAR